MLVEHSPRFNQQLREVKAKDKPRSRCAASARASESPFRVSLTCRYWHRLHSSGSYRRLILHRLRWKTHCRRRTRLSNCQCAIEQISSTRHAIDNLILPGCDYNLATVDPIRTHTLLTRLDINPNTSCYTTTLRTQAQGRRALRC